MAAVQGRRPPSWIIASLAIIAATAVTLWLMGHPLICKCGHVRLWHGVVFSSENSQHLTDWYTPTHVLHGLIFYFVLWLVARRWPLRFRFLIALVVESGWEVVENTPWIINRYREATISLDYFGDSVLNSMADILAMAIGFYLARRLPIWTSVAIVIAVELILAYAIRDGLTLNTLMLIYPIEAIRVWQAGG